MPDSNGWQISPDPRTGLIWHADCDQHVPNNREAKRAHLVECRRQQREDARHAEKERERAAAERLRLINRERSLERKVLGP